MKKIYVLGNEYLASKIIKKDNNITLINAVDAEGNSLGDLNFPNISNLEDYQLEEGQEWDIDENEQRILDLELAIAEILGGGL